MNTAKQNPQNGSESCNAMGIASNAKIDLFRMEYVGEKYKEIFKDSTFGAVVFCHKDDQNFVFLIAFSGRKKKPDFCFRFRTEDAAWAYQKKWHEELICRAQVAATRRAQKALPHGLQIGDVLVSSWGYDQTNIDYYEVTRLVGKQSVEIRQIEKLLQEKEGMHGDCVPRRGHYKSDAMVKRVGEGGYVKVKAWGVWARKKEEFNVSGMSIFSPDSFTSYA